MPTSTLLNSLRTGAVSVIGLSFQRTGGIKAAHLCCIKQTAIHETRESKATREQKQEAITQPPERNVEKPCEIVFPEGSQSLLCNRVSLPNMEEPRAQCQAFEHAEAMLGMRRARRSRAKRALGPDTIADTSRLVSTACAVLSELSIAACPTVAGTRCAVSAGLGAQAMALVAFRDTPA